MTEPTKLPKHKKHCAYVANPCALCTCGVKVVGQPFTHWQAMADELVVDALVRAIHNINYLSVPGQLAEARLTEILLQQNPEIVRKVLDEREQVMAGMQNAISAIIGGKK